MSQLSPELRERLEEKAYQIRRLSLEMITYSKVGHPGGSLSEADILACLYFGVMRHDPQNPTWPERDRFVMSKAHGCPGQYAALALAGYIPVDEIYSYGDIDSRLQAHPDMRKCPGVEMSGGSLGQGLSTAVGMALAMRHFERWRSRVYCLVGDGEMQEGQIWEAAMFAAHYHLDNLTVVLDYNKVQAKGLLYNMVGVEPVAEKWRGFGWEVLEVDGHDVAALMGALHTARDINMRGKPSLVIAHTVKGKGIEWMEFNYKWHTHAPSPQEADSALRGLADLYEREDEGYSRLQAEGTMKARAESDLGVADRPA